jgi:acyl-coenzyme A thioesterase PaaI-like protein
VWYNESGGVAGTVVHLGNGIEGWPFTVHGGALATILDECMGRVAILNLPARTAVTANLNINYRNMARSGQAYFVLVHIDRSASTDRKAIVTGKIYNQNSDLCVEAVGTFVVPRNYQLKELEAKF